MFGFFRSYYPFSRPFLRDSYPFLRPCFRDSYPLFKAFFKGFLSLVQGMFRGFLSCFKAVSRVEGVRLFQALLLAEEFHFEAGDHPSVPFQKLL